eukprot:403362423
MQNQVYETADFYPQQQSHTNANTNAQSVNSSNIIGQYLQPTDLNSVRILNKNNQRNISSQNRSINDQHISPDEDEEQYENQNYHEDFQQRDYNFDNLNGQLSTVMHKIDNDQQQQQFMSQDGGNVLSTGQAFNSMQMMSQESQQRHFNLLKHQEYQLMKERESLIYGSQNDKNIYSSGAGNIEVLSDLSYPISVSPGGENRDGSVSIRNYQTIENQSNGIASQRHSQHSQRQSISQNNASQFQGKNSFIQKSSANNSKDLLNYYHDLDYSQSRIEQNYDFLTQSQSSQIVDQNNSNFLIMSNQIHQEQNQLRQQPLTQMNQNIRVYPDTQAFLLRSEQLIEEQEQPYQDDEEQYDEEDINDDQQQHVEEEFEETYDQQNNNDDEDHHQDQDFDQDNIDTQRELSESLNLNDQEFNQNLKILYQRRILNSQKILDQLQIEVQKTSNHQDFIQNMRNQLLNNKNNCISQLKIKHHMLVLKLDSFLEQALDQIFQQESQQMDTIDQLHKRNQDNYIELECLQQMVELKMKMEKKTKFVQFYPDMMKQCDQVLQQIHQNDLNKEIDPLLSKLEAPQFDYQILSKQEVDQLNDNKENSNTLIIDKQVQCNLDLPPQNPKKQPEIVISDNVSQISRRTVGRNELDEQARSISKQLKHLKKETEYAKKIILNEKKLDHLIGVLDKSKEQIFRNSIDAYENNQTLIQEQVHRSQNKTHRSSSQMGSISIREGDSARNAKFQQPNQNNSINHNESYILSDRALQEMKSRADFQNKILRSNASVSSIHDNGDTSSITYNLASDEFQNNQHVPLRQKMQNLSQQKRHSLQTIDPKLTPTTYNEKNMQNTVMLPTPQTVNLSQKQNKHHMFKSDNKLAQNQQYPHQYSFKKNLNHHLDYSHQPKSKQSHIRNEVNNQDQSSTNTLLGHGNFGAGEGHMRSQNDLLIFNANNDQNQQLILNMPHSTPNQQNHNHSVNIVQSHKHNQSSSTSMSQYNNISYQNTYGGDYFEKLSRKKIQQENDQSSSNRSHLSIINNNDYHQVREGKIKQQRHTSRSNNIVTDYKQNQQSTSITQHKQKSVKFSKINQKSDSLNSTRNSGHFIIYLPFGGPEPYSTFYDCVVYKQGKFSVAKLLVKLLRHARVPSHERNRFFFQIQIDNDANEREGYRILNVDEDINQILGRDPSRWPIKLYLKESQLL